MKTYLEPQEIKLLAQAATNLRDRLLINLLLHTGCRISEALGLTVDDVHFDSGTLTILHLKAHVTLACPVCKTRLSRSSVFCPGCGEKVNWAISLQQEQRRMRTIPIDTDTLKLLEEYIKRGGVVEKEGKKLIFGINRHRAWQIIKQCADKVGLPPLLSTQSGKLHNVSPHRLRDSFAINAVKKNDSGDGLRMLQEHLGHQNISTTMNYRKVAGDELKNWYQHLWETDK